MAAADAEWAIVEEEDGVAVDEAKKSRRVGRTKAGFPSRPAGRQSRDASTHAASLPKIIMTQFMDFNMYGFTYVLWYVIRVIAAETDVGKELLKRLPASVDVDAIVRVAKATMDSPQGEDTIRKKFVGDLYEALKFSAPVTKNVIATLTKDVVPDECTYMCAGMLDADMMCWYVKIVCTQKESHWYGGTMYLQVILPPSYPNAPPEFFVITPNGIFMPNADVCVNSSDGAGGSYHGNAFRPGAGVVGFMKAFMSTLMDGDIDHGIGIIPKRERPTGSVQRHAAASAEFNKKHWSAVGDLIDRCFDVGQLATIAVKEIMDEKKAVQQTDRRRAILGIV